VNQLHLEFLALSLLCQFTDSSLRSELTHLLRSHSFLSPDHHAIFTALQSIPSHSPDEIQHHVPAALTRLGFPDIDTTPLFSPPVDPSQIHEVIRFFRRDAAQHSEPR
jgi:hypothetical protein